MHPELEKLIDLTLADGQIGEKERNVIMKKAAELGIDPEEVEVVLEGRLHQLQSSAPKNLKEKTGSIRTCPACGAPVKALELNCSSCDHEFTSVKATHSISNLLEKLNQITKQAAENDDLNVDQLKADCINNTPIPNTKEDLLEFLTVCVSQSNVGYLDAATGVVIAAWARKGNEAVMKAKLSFRNDPAALKIVEDCEKKLSSTKKKSQLVWVIFIVFVVGFLIYLGTKESEGARLFKSFNLKGIFN